MIESYGYGNFWPNRVKNRGDIVLFVMPGFNRPIPVLYIRVAGTFEDFALHYFRMTNTME